MEMDVFSYLSWKENDQISRINDFVEANKYCTLRKEEIDNFLSDNYIDYYDLPQYAKDKIDELDIY